MRESNPIAELRCRMWLAFTLEQSDTGGSLQKVWVDDLVDTMYAGGCFAVELRLT